MNGPEKKNENTEWLEPDKLPIAQKVPFYEIDTEGLKKFFDFTGGSILYCLSAVFVAYGIVNVMGPMLSMGEALKNAIPCIITLHAYELALLGVLILIVSKKVVDDAISVLIIIALFLVGTSIALGSVADTGIGASFWMGLLGIAIALVKLCVMRRFVKIQFGVISIMGLTVLLTCNYIGPGLMARSMAIGLLQESARREVWWLIWLVMLAGADLILIEMMRVKSGPQRTEGAKMPFLQTPIMAGIFALIVLAASGTHQYAIAYTSGLERVIGDYILIIAAGTMLVLEIIRLSGRRFAILDAIISCVPLAAMMFAIEEKSVLSGSEFALALLGYPPVILALTGVFIALWSLYHKRYSMLAIAIFYGLGVILTFGFSPEHPHDLNVKTCAGILIVVLFAYGLIKRNQYFCLAAIVVLCFGLSQWEAFAKLSNSYQLTKAGGLAGVFGLSSALLCLIFGGRTDKAIRLIGAICLAGFVFDYLPANVHWRYAIALAATVLYVGIIWFRTKDVPAISIPIAAELIRIYMAAKQIAYWRFVIVGFLLLAAGTVASLLKLRVREKAELKKEDG